MWGHYRTPKEDSRIIDGQGWDGTITDLRTVIFMVSTLVRAFFIIDNAGGSFEESHARMAGII